MADDEDARGWPFAEALPRFNILTLVKEWRRGARLLFWYDQDHRLVGSASFVLSDGTLDLSYMTDVAEGYLLAGKSIVQFDVLARDDGQRGERMAIICPGCRKQVEILLLFIHSWRCCNCHGVKNLTNSLDSATRLYMDLQEIDKIVRDRRPKGMHHATWARYVAEHKRLKAQWGRRAPRTLRAEHQWRVNERYFVPDDAPFPTEPEPPCADGRRPRRARHFGTARG